MPMLYTYIILQSKLLTVCLITVININSRKSVPSHYIMFTKKYILLGSTTIIIIVKRI